MNFTARITAMAALLALAPLSHAAATSGYASAHFSNMTLSVVDLDPLDAQAPSLTFNSPTYATALKATFTRDGVPDYGDFYLTHPELITSVHHTVGSATEGGSVDVTPGTVPSGPFDFQVRADLSLSNATQPYTASTDLVLVIMPDVMSGSSFTTLSLSPHTQLRLTGQVDLHADLGGPLTSGGLQGQVAYEAGWEASLFSYSGASASDSDRLRQDPSRDSLSKSLLLVIDNDSDDAVDVIFSLTGAASATGTVTSVPEPEGWALALGGLVAMGAWHGRGSKRQA